MNRRSFRIFSRNFVFVGMTMVLGLPGAFAKQDHLVMSCAILSSSGAILRQLPGLRCLFLPDGSFLSGDDKTLRRIDGKLHEIWKKPIENHHIITATSDGKFLLGSSERVEYKSKSVRFDVLDKIDGNGQVENSFHFLAHPELYKTFEPQPIGSRPGDAGPPGLELGHMNSYYEIPDNPMAKKLPAFGKGNVIVNSNGLNRVFILDPKLEKILWSFDYCKELGACTLHDVQVTSHGTILFYSNVRGEAAHAFSSLEEYDPTLRKIVWQYRASPPEDFHATVCGGVQFLENGNVLFTDGTKSGVAIEITRGGKELSRFVNIFDNAKTGLPAILQDAKKLDLSEFLAHNGGL